MNKKFIIAFLIPFFSYSQEDTKSASKYPSQIGDIEFDNTIDKENFELCSKHIYQYFNNSGGLEYEGEKLAIEKEFLAKYKSEYLKKESGLIRIQFVVNCKGETDRFRLLSMDENYKEKLFPKSITDQLLKITKNLKGWKPKKIEGREIDFYQYLIFKIENAQLKEILP